MSQQHKRRMGGGGHSSIWDTERKINKAENEGKGRGQKKRIGVLEERKGKEGMKGDGGAMRCEIELMKERGKSEGNEVEEDRRKRESSNAIGTKKGQKRDMSKRENVSPSFRAERHLSGYLYYERVYPFGRKKNATRRRFCSHFNKNTLGKGMSKQKEPWTWLGIAWHGGWMSLRVE